MTVTVPSDRSRSTQRSAQISPRRRPRSAASHHSANNRSSRDLVYADLVRRYLQDPAFADLVEAVAAGLGVAVLAVNPQSGAVLAAMADSVFEVRIDEYARRVSLRDRQLEMMLHGLIHLAVAALCFPRPDDLADDTYVGRVSVEQVDQVVREACRLLDERTAAADNNADPPDDAADPHAAPPAAVRNAGRPVLATTQPCGRLT